MLYVFLLQSHIDLRYENFYKQKYVYISTSINNFYPYYLLPVKRYVVKIIIWESLILLIHMDAPFRS